MHKRLGFTVVEVIIVIVIIGILLTISVVSFRTMQSGARDKERESDVQAIATYVESLFGRDLMSGGVNVSRTGSYPPTVAVSQASYYADVFNDLTRGVQYAPREDAARAFVAATSNNPAPTESQYLYVPLTSAGSLCTDITTECRSFKIYYRLEQGGVKFLESKRK